MAKHILPASVAAVGTAALVWNTLAGAAQAQQQIQLLTPQWITAALAVAVSTGLIGSLGLIRGRRWASVWFFLSAIAVLAQMLGSYASASVREAIGASGLALPLALFVVCASLWAYAQRAIARGWLR